MDYYARKTGPGQTMPTSVATSLTYEVNSDKPERMPFVADAMVSLEARVTDIMDRLVTLEKRLSPVLRPSGPEAGENAAQSLSMPPLAEALRTQVNKLNYAHSTLCDILERIEL